MGVDSKSESLQAFPVVSFHEKPEVAKAQSFLEKGNFCWNSGMFIFTVETMVGHFKKWMPELWSEMDKLQGDFSNLSSIFEKISPESLDYGVMEHAENQACIPCDIDWSDLGSWDDIEKFSARAGGNSKNIFSFEAKNNFAFSLDQKNICFLGVENLQVVDTPDVLFVGGGGQSQKVKQLLEVVKKQQPQLAEEHTFEDRPWGNYRSLHESEDCKVKVIEVDAGQQLSYQSHEQRSEIWVVVRGEGEVVLNDEVRAIKKAVLLISLKG